MASPTTEDPLVREQLLAQQARAEDRRDLIVRGVRQVVVFALFVALLAGAYVGYKALSDSLDDRQTDWPVVGSVLPRGDNLNMPPLSDIVGQFGEVPRGQTQTYARILLGEGLFTLREAAVGFVAGVVIGLLLAMVLVRSQWLDRGVVPYI
ncbi:MAG: hypothetical protein HKN26_15030, partial [Acidimicrobiales bacterium]|nr:hypothetical protein [Acidimicrobiales bacterium]